MDIASAQPSSVASYPEVQLCWRRESLPASWIPASVGSGHLWRGVQFNRLAEHFNHPAARPSGPPGIEQARSQGTVTFIPRVPSWRRRTALPFG